MPDDLPDPEWLAFETGLKPAIRVSLPVEKEWSRGNFPFVQSAQTVRWPNQPEQKIVYVARSRETAEALRDAEAPVFPGVNSKLSMAERRAAHERIGSLLGFPSCCVAAFLDRVERGVTRRQNGEQASEDFVAAEDAVGGTKIFHGRLNDLRRRERLWLIPFYPCRYDCETGLTYATSVFEEVRRIAPTAAERLQRALSQPVLVSPTLTVPFDRF